MRGGYREMGLEGGKRCMVLETLSGKSIGKVIGSGDGFRPKISRNTRVKHSRTGHLKECTVFPFRHAILLGCVRTRCLMYEAFLLKEKIHVRVDIFSTIISSEHARLGLKLGTDHIIELNEHMKNFRFLFKKINPTHAGTIINKGNKVRKTM